MVDVLRKGVVNPKTSWVGQEITCSSCKSVLKLKSNDGVMEFEDTELCSIICPVCKVEIIFDETL